MIGLKSISRILWFWSFLVCRDGDAGAVGVVGYACGCVLERVVCRFRFARVSCPWLRFLGLLSSAREFLKGAANCAAASTELTAPSKTCTSSRRS